MKKLLLLFAVIAVACFASCGGSTGSKTGMSAADSIRLQDSLDALEQAEMDAIQEAERAALKAARDAEQDVPLFRNR